MKKATSPNLCKYVDVFYGNGETDRFFNDGLASKWFYIKALCGNTTPHAALPFGKMTVGAYSGGFPTGYGTHFPISCGGILKLGETQMVRGFSHIHHTGTGGIRYYYNYAITTPFYEDLSEINTFYPIEDEQARPGYYSAKLRDISCELTVDGGVALHKYTFKDKGGRVAVDFSNDGLNKRFGDYFLSHVKDATVSLTEKGEVICSGIFSGIRLYFCVKAENAVKCSLFNDVNEISSDVFKIEDNTKSFGAVFDFEDREAFLRITYSTISPERAIEALNASKESFEAVSTRAYDIWNKTLSSFKIKTDDEELKVKFYSNLYHSLIKPCDMTGERILGINDAVSDFATLWDQYKTALPLIFMCYREMSEKIAAGIVNMSKTFGKLPCSLGLTEMFSCEIQAKMLGIFVLCDAYYMGIKNADITSIEECIARELARDDYKVFIENGIFEAYTHILDVTDACFDVAKLTENKELKERLLSLAENWRKAYGDDGIMSDESEYYEGDKYTYSFRIQANIEERVELAGGKERFAKLLDDFFGYNGDSIKPITHFPADKDIAATHYHRFQGFNNECDLEAPYTYIYADRHDRVCEIVHECVSRSFGMGRGGLPGNNDSGGLSSCFIWNALGIFPASGKGEFLIGAPQLDESVITLSNGKSLTIIAHNRNGEHIYVDKVTFNGVEVTDYRISTTELMQGGVIEFFMK